ncbi:MAG: hypothetical protein C0501_12720 [Isosphaera sp.]|nr:hypothetical protein [Isosphaera sp.]
MKNAVFFAAAVTAATLAAAAANAAGPDAAPPDPKVRMAQIAKEEVEYAEKALAKTEADILKEVDEAVAGMALDKPGAEKLAVDGMRRVAARGRALAKKLVEGHAAYAASAKALKGVYARSPAVFRDAAKTFRGYAAEEEFEDIRKDYLTCAETWESLAKVMEKRVEAIAEEEKAIAETMRMVERTGVFLERFEAHLASYPDLSAGEDRQKFLDQLRRYVQTYEGLRGSLGKFNEQLKKQALAPDLRPKAGDAAVASGRPDAARQPAVNPAVKPATPAEPAAPVNHTPVTPATTAVAGQADGTVRIPVGEFVVIENGRAYLVRMSVLARPVPAAGTGSTSLAMTGR